MSVMETCSCTCLAAPKGVLGRLGGFIMARTNEACGAWVAELLQVGPNDTVLEVGFGPGVIVERLARLASKGHVAGIDPAAEMVEQARARNSVAIQNGRVDLRRRSVDSLPFDDDSFEKVLAINSMQVWADALAGVREIRRGLKPASPRAPGSPIFFGAADQGFAAIA